MEYGNDLDFMVDIDSKLKDMRQVSDKKPVARQAPVKQANEKQDERRIKPAGGGASGNNPPTQNQTKIPEVPHEAQKDDVDAGLDVTQSQQEDPRDDVVVSATDGAVREIGKDKAILWDRFLVLEGMFEYQGGPKPIGLADKIARTNVSRIPAPLLDRANEKLKGRVLGKAVHFPWGIERITESNKVLSTRSSLVRYLLFDLYKDAEGTHVQYAFQWLALQFPTIYSADFDKDASYNEGNDALDIFMVLQVMHDMDLREGMYGVTGQGSDSGVSDLADNLSMVNENLQHLKRTQEVLVRDMRAGFERDGMLQAILFLERLGLIKGQIPRDLDGLNKLFEDNRDTFDNFKTVVNQHLANESLRKDQYQRDARSRR